MKREVSRRTFLQGTGAALAAIGLSRLVPLPNFDARLSSAARTYSTFEDLYREKWTWDRVTWGTHLVDCYPGSCSWRIYTKGGVVFREEQASLYPVIEEGVPDMNPRGCQKGGCFSEVMYGAERITYPMKRAGERGEGKWQRVSWDEALTIVADGVLDAIESHGPESIINDFGTGEGGIVHGAIPSWRLVRLLGGTVLDNNALTSDFNVGLYETFGKFQFVSSIDDWYKADLILLWHMNPLYTRIPSAHYIMEARYNGTKVVSIAPDYNASTIHADLYVPVQIGADAALALGVCKLLIDEGAIDTAFVKEQTDLPLLVREDTGRYLRQPDVEGEGREDQLYVWDEVTGAIAKAPRATLRLDGIDPSLDGEREVRLHDGTSVSVRPAFARLRDRLDADYSLEQASRQSGVSAGTIRRLAAMVKAAKRIHILQGFNTPKYYHGDLIERSMALLLALTGNFGRPGTGLRGHNSSQLVMANGLKGKVGLPGFMELADNQLAIEEEAKAEDPDLTSEMLAVAVERAEARRSGLAPVPMSGITIPPHFFWYWHGGFKEAWNNRAWSDPEMKRTFDEYFQEAIDRGWWDDLAQPGPDQTPQVLIGACGNTLRRTRGADNLLKTAWPKLKLVATIDYRMSATGRQSDVFLPAAAYYEKTDFRFPTAHLNFLVFTDKAVEPPGEAKPEWEINWLLAEKIEERARERGMDRYTDRRGREFRLHGFLKRFGFNGEIGPRDDEKIAEDLIFDTVRAGALPEKTTLATLRKKGIVRFQHIGIDAVGMNQATDIEPDKTVNPLTWHVRDKLPYPSYARRIQFYIDHEWFLEAGEELPVHKATPRMGGDHPLVMTSGHQRWSIHSMWVLNRTLSQTHRGHPTLFMNPADMKARSIDDDETVRVRNDFSEFQVRVKVSPSCRPGQVIIYHAWEPMQFPGGKSYDVAIPGLIKWLHMAGGYGHLNYYRWNWMPQQVDRAVTVEVEKVA